MLKFIEKATDDTCKYTIVALICGMAKIIIHLALIRMKNSLWTVLALNQDGLPSIDKTLKDSSSWSHIQSSIALSQLYCLSCERVTRDLRVNSLALWYCWFTTYVLSEVVRPNIPYTKWRDLLSHLSSLVLWHSAASVRTRSKMKECVHLVRLYKWTRAFRS